MPKIKNKKTGKITKIVKKDNKSKKVINKRKQTNKGKRMA